MKMFRRVILGVTAHLKQANRASQVTKSSRHPQISLLASGSIRLQHSHHQDNPSGSVVSQHTDHLELALEGKTTKVHHFWLRDHCRCQTCWNAKTAQKNVRFQDIDVNIAPIEYKVEGDFFKVSWPDGHNSSYLLQWLFENDPQKSLIPKEKKILWNGESYYSLKFERVKFKDFMNEDECLEIFLKNFATYGFAFVDEVPADMEHTIKVSERVGPLHETLFGKSWELQADGARADTAYTNIALGAHTDMTYFQQTTGIQVFHCIYHDGKGGETLMEDGFFCANKLKDTNPEAYDILANTYVNHDYMELSHGQHLQSLERIIRHHPLTNEIEQFRYNNYDRITVKTIPVEKIMSFYNSVKALSEIVEDEANVHWEKLWPGSVYFVDNWRVMHGRQAFTGKRFICGSYIERDAWISRARALQIL